MTDKTENSPIDARLLSDAIIELNISRRNVSIYPQNHPIVEQSLNRAFNFFQNIFELRDEVTLAIAKDTLIIDSYYLDKQNPIYKEFALCLSRINISHVTFSRGLTKDELYSFHHFILKNTSETFNEDVSDSLKEYDLYNITVGFIDFSVFDFIEGKAEHGERDVPLWEQYVSGLLDGRLQTADASGFMQEISPEKLAGLINRAGPGDFKEESYDRVITSYVRRSSERAFSGKELKKLLDFINELRPELKRQFLSSVVNTASGDMGSLEKMLGDMSADDVIDLLSMINEQVVNIPEALRNLLDQFSRLNIENLKVFDSGEGLMEDDIFLPPEVTDLMGKGDFKTFVSDSYQQEIQGLLHFDARRTNEEWMKEFENELKEEYIERDFNHILLELLLSDMPGVATKEDFEYFISVVSDQLEQFVETGQYRFVLKTLKVLQINTTENRAPESAGRALKRCHSPEFIKLVVDSFRVMGRKMREDVLLLCDYYGEKIVPMLLDVLIEEESPSTRRFVISLITYFKEKAVPEILKRLGDSRWFVKRNMIYILNECGGEYALNKVRPYCNHENPKVSFEALKCTLKNKDPFAIESLKKHLRSESKETVRRAIAFAGAFRVYDVVPDLIQLIDKKAITGKDYEDKMPAVKALGQIGDPRALDILNDILSSKTLLFRGSLGKLKTEASLAIEKIQTGVPDLSGSRPDIETGNLIEGNEAI